MVGLSEQRVLDLAYQIVLSDTPDWEGHPMNSRMSYSRQDVVDVVVKGINAALDEAQALETPTEEEIPDVTADL